MRTAAWLVLALGVVLRLVAVSLHDAPRGDVVLDVGVARSVGELQPVEVGVHFPASRVPFRARGTDGVGREGDLPVERFMRDYYRHARAIQNYSELVIEQCQKRVTKQPRRRRVVDAGDGFRLADGQLEIPHAAHLRERFGVDSFESSAALLRRRVEQTASDRLVFFAHNGPSGLGERREDIWGCDFRKTAGDFGDADLADAIDHASRSGRRVRAVVAGHMHHQLRGGGARRWQTERDGILYVNAAQVPRIRNRRGAQHRHHVELSIGDDHAYAREVWLRS